MLKVILPPIGAVMTCIGMAMLSSKFGMEGFIFGAMAAFGMLVSTSVVHME